MSFFDRVEFVSKILVVEDDKTLLEMLKYNLER